jgi:hypothetical protein
MDDEKARPRGTLDAEGLERRLGFPLGPVCSELIIGR